ncbi:MAG: energy transducer TonB [Terriglobia bacterium]
MQEIKGPKSRYRFRWKGQEPNENQIREAFNQVLPLLKGNLEGWRSYWPPKRPPSRPGQPLNQQPSQEIAPGIFTLGTDATPPVCEFCPDPPYPHKAQMDPVRGVLELWIVVTETGRVAGIQIAKSLGHGLDNSAVMTVANWRFRPGLLNGRTVRVLMRVEIYFRLFYPEEPGSLPRWRIET